MALSPHQHRSIDQLLTDWRVHDDLRRAGADIPELFQSNQRLADARAAARSAR